MAALQKPLLGDLQINDIKKELEKRNLGTTGVKSVLVDRLSKAIINEGEDPNTFQFDVDAAGAASEEADEEIGDLANEKTDETNGASVSGGCDFEQGEISTVSHFGEIGGIDAVQGNMPGEGEENGSRGKRNANASSASQDCGRPSTAKSNTGTSNITTPAKGKKSQSSVKCEGGDESFVVQEDDVVLNDIDSDLLDGEGKAPNSGSAGEAGIYGDANNGELDSAATLENTHGDQTAAGSKDGKDTSEAKSSAQPVKKDQKTSQTGRNLWVSGLFSNTRATDLKTLFSKHGKVVAAKVVTNARSPASRCFGLVTLSSADEATKCVEHLHHTEFHGRKISIERAQTETQGGKEKILPPSGLRTPAKAAAQGSETKPLATKKDDEHHRRTSVDTPGNKDRKRDEAKIKADEVRDRLRRKEQFLEREKFKQRMIERKQWEETQKIERERRRLREMREELERRQMETERLRLETERLHMEKEQEKYRKQRIFQERRALKRRAQREEEWPNKHPATERFHGGEGDFNRRVQVRRKFREERPPPREGRLARDERAPRGPPRHDSRSDWKSERGTWNGPVDNSKLDNGWGKYDMEQVDGWDNGVVLSQSGGNYALQQGQMMTSGMGTGTVFIAQPAIQTSPAMMHNNVNRQSDGRFGMAAASVRNRY